jgi:hypothetical protein
VILIVEIFKGKKGGWCWEGEETSQDYAYPSARYGSQEIMLTRLLAMATHALAEVSFMKSANAICVFTIS